MSKAPEIIIVGRGIAELTLALALFEVGIRARVFESASESRELGVGINVLPHATKEFERLGILNRLTNSGLELERYIWFNRFGQEIFSEARGLRAGYEWPQVAIHRGIFHRILFDTVIDRLGADAVALDHHLLSFSQKDDKVRAEFVSKKGDRPRTRVEGDLLVAADGIHSVVRQHH